MSQQKKPMYKITCSLINSWMYATDSEAPESAFPEFLSNLAKEKREKSKEMQEGNNFERHINRMIMRIDDLKDIAELHDEEQRAVLSFAERLKDAQIQVYQQKEITIDGVSFLLVGIADAVRAGVISDIKRVQRYEYGKYQHSAQHPMYFELFPEAVKFNYLIFDGKYCYQETYRRGDFQPIEMFIRSFMNYLEGADLMDIYKEKWSV